MVTEQALMNAYKATPLGPDSFEFEVHREWYLRELRECINDRTFEPTTYTFITEVPRPREVIACDAGTRTNDHYIDQRLRPILEKEMTNRTFNNRIGFGPDAAINQVIEDVYNASCGFTRDCWIIKYDLSGYFPHAIRQTAYEQLTDVVRRNYHEDDKDDLLYLIRQAVLSDPLARCERRSPKSKWQLIPPDKSIFNMEPGIGASIGRLIWQNGMNYYLNDLDHWAVDEMKLLYTRFVDDTVIVTPNKEAVLSLFPEIRRRLAEKGCRMHPHKFVCQHWSKGFEFVGRHVKVDRVYVNNRILFRAEKRIRELNRCPRPEKVETFQQCLNSYIGQCKTCNGYARMRDLLDVINPEWWDYTKFNEDRLCIQALPGYGHRERIEAKYHIKPSRHDRRKRHQRNASQDHQARKQPPRH